MTPPLPGDQGYEGVDVDGAGIDMYPEPAGHLMSNIADTSKNAKDGWDTNIQKIEDLASKLGEGPMGKPFKEQYDPAAKKLKEFVPDHLERLGKLSKSGTEAVPLYVKTDQQAGQQFEF
jgi:hypothetical protein